MVARKYFSNVFTLRSSIIALLVNTIGFQIFVLTRISVLYNVLRILFVGLVLIAAGTFLKAARRNKGLLILAAVIVAIRIPYLVHFNGMITTSDNAVEALQSVDIQKQKIVPFFLNESIRHQGTLGYLWVSFLWDMFGQSYFWILALHIILFGGFLAILGRMLKTFARPGPVAFLLLLQFAFIENIFDYSLYIRGGPYLEMLFFFFLGATSFDTTWNDKGRVLIGAYFMAFSVYLHPLGLIFAGAFVATLLFSCRIPRGRIIRNIAVGGAGVIMGILHQIYYIVFFTPKPIELQSESLSLIPISQWNIHLLSPFVGNFAEIFRNIYNFEVTYLSQFFGSRGLEKILVDISKINMVVSGLVFAAGLVMTCLRLLRWLRRKEPFVRTDWLYVYFAVLTGVVVAKIMFLKPAHLEPRHNFDLTLLIIMAFGIVLGRFLPDKPWRSVKGVTIAVLLCLFTLPHGYLFAKNAIHKQKTYTRLVTTLQQYNVRNLTTDFILAYTIHFLSKETISVSPSLGPFSLNIFFKEMREGVDRLPLAKKAYLYFAPTYFRRPWHVKATNRSQSNLLSSLRLAIIPFETVKLPDYVLIIPKEAENGQ